MKIIVLGDIGASSFNLQAFCEAEKSLFSDEIVSICKNADIVLLNLEKPLVDQLSPLGKCPPDYYAPTKTINGIKMLSPTAVTLANNHIMDQGNNGLYSTIAALRENDIQYVGVGYNITEARKPLIIEKKGIRIGIYACCEKEFSYAEEDRPGANIFDPLFSLDDITILKKQCDHLIVLFHGGMQGYPYPTPRQQQVCRKMIDKGANLIVCQHSHVIGCEEEYNGAHIVYGQGDFLLDDTNEDDHAGIIIEESLVEEKQIIKFYPIETRNHRVNIASQKDSYLIIKEFEKRSNEIVEAEVVKKHYQKLCEKKISDYLLKLSGSNMLVQRALRRFGLTKAYSGFLYNMAARYRLLDYLFCDTHREAIETGLTLLSKK